LCEKCCHNTSCWVSHTYTSSEDEANQPKTDVDKTGVPADDDAIDVAAFRQELERRNHAELVAREGPAAPPGAEAAPAEAAPVWAQVVSTTGAPLEPRRLEQWELLFERKKVEARFWATELEAAAAEVVTVVANLGVSGLQQARARDRERSAREMIESLKTQAAGAVRCRLACARSRAVVAQAEAEGVSPGDVDMASYPLTLLSAEPRVVPVEDLEDLSHGKSPQDALTAQARHATAEAEPALLDSDTTQSATGAAALPDSDTTQGAEVGGDSETGGESTASDDSGPGRAPGYKPSCMFTHGGPSIEAVAAHRKRQLEGVVEAQPKKKKKQQPITDYLAATTGEPEGAEPEDVPVCDHRMLICRQGFSLKKDFSYIPECPDCGQLIHVGHLGFCPDKCGCGDYLAAYPPDP